MLEESKKLYENFVNLYLPNWKTFDKNELCNLYIEHETDPTWSQVYFSAILLKYWPAIAKQRKTCYFYVTPEDAYDWVLTAIQYALEHRRWLDKDSSIYQDPTGPDKAINRKLKCTVGNYVIANMRNKHVVNANIYSLDSLKEDYNDWLQPTEKETDDIDIDINLYIKALFERKEYFSAFIIYAIVNYDCFENGKFSEKKLRKIFRSICDKDYYLFAEVVDLEFEDVLAIYNKYVKNLTNKELLTNIEYSMNKLRVLLSNWKW